MHARRECPNEPPTLYPPVTGVTPEPREGTYSIVDGRKVKAYPIPKGTYNIEYYVGKKNPRAFHLFTGHLKNPKFGDILIHSGQFAFHTEGCIMVGSSVVDGYAPNGPYNEAYNAMRKAHIFEETEDGRIRTAVLNGSSDILGRIMNTYDGCTSGGAKLSISESSVSIS